MFLLLPFKDATDLGFKPEALNERFTQIYREHFPRIVAFLKKRGAGDESEDLAQRVFARSDLLLNYNPAKSHIFTYLCQIARTEHSNHLRSIERNIRKGECYSDFRENRPMETGLISDIERVIPADMRPVFEALRAGLNGEDCDREGICSRATFSRHKRAIAAMVRELTC